jgi:hypothetical protein
MLLAGRPAAAPRLAVTTPLAEMVAALNDFRPEALTAYPSVAAALAEEQLQGRLRIAPTTVATSSEVQTADMRRRMAEAGGLAPLDFYGTTEALVPALGRQGQTGMDVLEDLVVLEVVDEQNRPVLREEAPADTPARVRAALVRELRDAGAVPPPVEVIPVAGIDRDPGHGAKLKLVETTLTRA